MKVKSKKKQQIKFTRKQQIVAGDRVFQYNPDNDDYVYMDGNLCGFLRQSSDNDDYWEFSGDGCDLWEMGSLARVGKYLIDKWKPIKLDRVELIILIIEREYRSLKLGDLISSEFSALKDIYQVIEFYPQVEHQQEAIECQNSKGKKLKITLECWRNEFWRIVGRSNAAHG